MPRKNQQTRPPIRSPHKRNLFVLHFQWVVWDVWSRVRSNTLIAKLGEEDALAAGQLGLLRASELWDGRKGFKFSTYASDWVRHHIQKAARDNLVIQVPMKVTQGRRQERLPTDRVAQLLNVVYPDQCVDSDTHHTRTWEPWYTEDFIPVYSDEWEKVLDALRFVHRRYREPMLQYYRDGMTYAEIGQLQDPPVTMSRVEQLVAFGMKRLRLQLKAHLVSTVGEEVLR